MTITYGLSVGGKERSEALSIRINNKLKFTLDLWARMEGKSVTSLVSELLERAARDPANKPAAIRGETSTLAEFVGGVWDVLEPDRVVKLAQMAPEVLSDYEQIIWKLIKEHPECWIRSQPQLPKIRKLWGPITVEAKSLIDKLGK